MQGPRERGRAPMGDNCYSVAARKRGMLPDDQFQVGGGMRDHSLALRLPSRSAFLSLRGAGPENEQYVEAKPGQALPRRRR